MVKSSNSVKEGDAERASDAVHIYCSRGRICLAGVPVMGVPWVWTVRWKAVPYNFPGGGRCVIGASISEWLTGGEAWDEDSLNVGWGQTRLLDPRPRFSCPFPASNRRPFRPESVGRLLCVSLIITAATVDRRVLLWSMPGKACKSFTARRYCPHLR